MWISRDSEGIVKEFYYSKLTPGMDRAIYPEYERSIEYLIPKGAPKDSEPIPQIVETPIKYDKYMWLDRYGKDDSMFPILDDIMTDPEAWVMEEPTISLSVAYKDKTMTIKKVNGLSMKLEEWVMDSKDKITKNEYVIEEPVDELQEELDRLLNPEEYEDGDSLENNGTEEVPEGD
jgi:hypothetical protein